MYKNKNSVWLLLILLVSTLQFFQCEIDHGLKVEEPSELIRHGIKGTLTFSGNWPDNIAEARLVASANFPPDPADPLDAFIFSDPIQVGINTLDYGLTLVPASYQIIAVIVREKNQSWDISNILSVYAPLAPCTIIPDPDHAIEIESDRSIVDSVDVEVDLTKGSISGQVNFSGVWSPNFSIAGILAFEYPLDLSNPVPCGIGLLPVEKESADFRIIVPDGDYVLAVVVAESLANITDISDITIVGFYLDPENTSDIGVVSVKKNQDTSEIVINAILSSFSE